MTLRIDLATYEVCQYHRPIISELLAGGKNPKQKSTISVSVESQQATFPLPLNTPRSRGRTISALPGNGNTHSTRLPGLYEHHRYTRRRLLYTYCSCCDRTFFFGEPPVLTSAALRECCQATLRGAARASSTVITRGSSERACIFACHERRRIYAKGVPVIF